MPRFCQKNRRFSLAHPMHWLGLAPALVALGALPGALPLRGAISAQATSGVPRGVFSLGKAGDPTDPAVFANPSVDGISIRQTWNELEKSKGNFDWSFLDSEVAKAQKWGKAVLVRILSEGPSTPGWVYAEGVQTFTYQDRNPYHLQSVGKFAIFWDKTYLAEKKRMLQAVGQHLSENSSVKIIAAVTASSRSGDWHVPHTPADIEHWHAVGYSTEKLFDVCKQIIDVTMESFPNQHVLMSVAPNGKLDLNPDCLSRLVIEYGRTRYPGRMIFERNSLSAVSPPAVPGRMKHFKVLWDNRPNIAAQMLWFTYGDPTCRNNGRRAPCDPALTLRKAVDIGAGYGLRFIEIYQRDVISLPDVIRYAHEVYTK